MKYLGLALLIALVGCSAGNEKSLPSEAAASLEGLYPEKTDKSEKERSAKSKAPAKSTNSVNTLIDLYNDTPFGADDYLCANGFREIKNPGNTSLKHFKSKRDSSIAIIKSFGAKSDEKYVAYSFPSDELFVSIKEQAQSLGFSPVSNQPGKEMEVFTRENQTLKFIKKHKGVYTVILQKN